MLLYLQIKTNVKEDLHVRGGLARYSDLYTSRFEVAAREPTCPFGHGISSIQQRYYYLTSQQP
jgi:hypothetical protein